MLRHLIQVEKAVALIHFQHGARWYQHPGRPEDLVLHQYSWRQKSAAIWRQDDSTRQTKIIISKTRPWHSKLVIRQSNTFSLQFRKRLRDRAIETEQMHYGTSFSGSKYCSPPLLSASYSADPLLLKLSKTPRSYLFSFIYALPPLHPASYMSCPPTIRT